MMWRWYRHRILIGGGDRKCPQTARRMVQVEREGKYGDKEN
jgi:hypothetical protein